MSESVDRILDLIDGGLQSSSESGFTSDRRSGTCARCQRHQSVGDGDLCEGCRAFLLEDSDVDPRERQSAEDPAMAQWFAERQRSQRDPFTRTLESINRERDELRRVREEVNRRNQEAVEHGLTPENMDQVIHLPPLSSDVTDVEIHEVMLFKDGSLYKHYQARRVPDDVVLTPVPEAWNWAVGMLSDPTVSAVFQVDHFRRVGYVTTPMLTHFSVLKRHVYVWESRR